MNILLVTMSMDIGGAETHILELAKELKKRKNNVFVVSAGGKLVEKLIESGIEHVYAPLKDKKINHIIKSYKTIKSMIIEKKIDVVHAHARIPGAICGTVCKKMHVPFVTTVHGIYKVNFIYKLLTNWGERTLAVSEDIKNQVIKDYKLKKENVKVTINGIDTEKFKKNLEKKQEMQKEIGLKSGKKTVIHISRLDRESSNVAETLIKISPSLAKKGVQIVIVGDGNNFDELKKIASNAPNVIMTGARTDVNDVLNVADVFVGVSRSALEAMATEMIVILAGNKAYNQGYQGIFEKEKLKDALNTNFCCRAMKMLEPEELESDIEKALKMNENDEMGKYNRNVVERYYSVQKMADDAVQMYNEILEEKGSNSLFGDSIAKK